jgi:hypothetical protein
MQYLLGSAVHVGRLFVPSFAGHVPRMVSAFGIAQLAIDILHVPWQLHFLFRQFVNGIHFVK